MTPKSLGRRDEAKRQAPPIALAVQLLRSRNIQRHNLRVQMQRVLNWKMNRCQCLALRYTAKLNSITLRDQMRYLTTACAEMYIQERVRLQVSECAVCLPWSFIPWTSKDDLHILRQQKWSGIWQLPNHNTVRWSHPSAQWLTLQSIANLRASMSAELRSLVVSKASTKLRSFLGCQKIAWGAASPPPLTPHNWNRWY
jgi:hypothetical protein